MSKIITARSNFSLEVVTKPGKCRGCKVKIGAGERVYVSRYKNPNNRGQNCVALLCNLEECYEEWDSEVFTARMSQMD